ncbi:MAG: AIR synthase family protein [Lachnospiraceae bacterium]|nr:AIR synthase family protein [Lachnospiraceae bacterium]
MEIGKIPENVLKRSVFKKLNIKREEVLVHPGIGEDCAALQVAADEMIVLSTDPITGAATEIGSLAFHVTANDIASAGAELIGMLVTIILPPESTEAMLKEIMESLTNLAQQHKVEIIGGHTEVSAVVNQPLVSVTGVGKVKKDRLITTGGLKPGDDIVVTKYIGIEGSSIIAHEREERLREQFSEDFIERVKSFGDMLSVLPEGRIAAELSASAMHDVTEGGIFGALWEMAAASGVGLEIDLKAIPIRQETVEICEVFDINPYMLISSGSMLIGTSRGTRLVSELEKAGVPAVVVGHATVGNDRVIINGDEKRFLEPPKVDELYKIYEN